MVIGTTIISREEHWYLFNKYRLIFDKVGNQLVCTIKTPKDEINHNAAEKFILQNANTAVTELKAVGIEVQQNNIVEKQTKITTLKIDLTNKNKAVLNKLEKNLRAELAKAHR